MPDTVGSEIHRSVQCFCECCRSVSIVSNLAGVSPCCCEWVCCGTRVARARLASARLVWASARVVGAIGGLERRSAGARQSTGADQTRRGQTTSLGTLATLQTIPPLQAPCRPPLTTSPIIRTRTTRRPSRDLPLTSVTLCSDEMHEHKSDQRHQTLGSLRTTFWVV